MSIRVEGRALIVDLHGQPTGYAVHEIAPACVEAAWNRGCLSVTLIHGSPDVTKPWHANVLGRGSMKWALRGALRRGEFMPWAWYRGSVRHRGLESDSGSMTLALRPNPNADPQHPLPEIEPALFDYEGPWHRARW